MDPRITRFLKHHHVLALATVSDAGPWTAHCFYAYLPDHQAMVFTSDPETRHGQNILANPQVSAGIALETKVIGLIRGVQLSGTAQLVANDELAKAARSAYLMRFPFALAAKLDLWVLNIEYIKFTDNRLGFGKKLEWRKEG